MYVYQCTVDIQYLNVTELGFFVRTHSTLNFWTISTARMLLKAKLIFIKVDWKLDKTINPLKIMGCHQYIK